MQNIFLRHLILCFSVLLLFTGYGNAEESHDAHEHGAETIWTCSMHPQIQLPESGQCPICFMDLIEVQKEKSLDKKSLRQVSFDYRARKLAEVEVQPVGRSNGVTEIRMVGKVDYDETRVGTITSWVNGRIDKMFVDFTGSHVRRGQPMVKIYSPELLSAQAELIQASVAHERTAQSGNEIIKKTALRTLEASREKLRLLGLGDKQLEMIEKQRKPTDHIQLTAPLSGIVIEKNVNEGMYVKTGSPIYTLADLDQVWVVLEAYESDLHGIALGQKVLFSVEAYPGTTFQGEVAYIDPLVSSDTRTVRVRLNVTNKNAKLKPGMFVRASSSVDRGADPSAGPLLIPASAPLITGKRALVYVQEPNQAGVYEGREVVLGARQGAFYQVKSGLSEGELVVSRGSFKIDSAIQLQGRPSMMNPYFKSSSDSELPYPSLFESRLNLLNKSFADLSKEVHQKKEEKIGPSLEQFGEILRGLSGEDLSHDDQLKWREISMLLGSDLVLLAESESGSETERLYVTFAEHFHQLRKHFQLNDVQATRLGSPELRSDVNTLLQGYLRLQQSLAEDDMNSAQKAGKDLIPAAAMVSEALLVTGEEAGQRLAIQLTDDLLILKKADSLEGLRTAFYPFSQTVIQIVETFGSASDTPIYEQFCPMAFGNTGATWLATSEEINNPYFGGMMLRCGEVKKQIAQ